MQKQNIILYNPPPLNFLFHFYYRKSRTQVTSQEEEDDVLSERKRIETEQNDNSDILKIDKLTKIFGRSLGKDCVAVDNISMGVKSGEVYLNF